MQTFLQLTTTFAALTTLIIFFVERHDKKKQKPFSTLSDKIDMLATESRNADAELNRSLLRLQMLNLMDHRPEDVAELMKIAEKYFCQFEGNWYMDGRFRKHCEENNIPLPSWFEK